MTDSGPRTALIDESFRADGDGLYLLVAAVVPDIHQTAVTDLLRTAIQRGQRRWHFTKESAASRARFVSTVATLTELGVIGVAVACRNVSERKTEQARARCLWALLAALDEHQVTSLVVESRQAALDNRDRREIENIKRSQVLAAAAYRHDRPMNEPLLWIPDALAGAIGLHIALGDSDLVELLPQAMRDLRWV